MSGQTVWLQATTVRRGKGTPRSQQSVRVEREDMVGLRLILADERNGVPPVVVEMNLPDAHVLARTILAEVEH